MKIKLSDASRTKVFSGLTGRGYGTKDLADVLSVHRRTISDWKRGKYNIEQSSFKKLVLLSAVKIDVLKYDVIDPLRQKALASKLGGKARWKKYGSLGTKEDKVKGGVNSYKKRVSDLSDIFEKKQISKPQPSVALAEFVGICMGDGGITKYQLSISLNDEDDKEYMDYVSKRAMELFDIEVKFQKRVGKKCTNLVMSSVELVDYLVLKGLPIGDKIRAGLDIPEWVKSDQNYAGACIRGLFDTDGSIFLETHRVKGRIYSYPRMSFVSASEPLRESVCDALLAIGINALIRSNRCVTIERFTDIEKYFRIVGSSNEKHLRRFAQFGGVG